MKEAAAAPRLLTVPEAAERLGVQRRKIYELMASGDLASVKLPPGTPQSGRRIEEAEISAFIDRNRGYATAKSP
jgi:excisionase family DNA binding protein